MKTVGKITRPFKDDLNQIPYDFTVEVTKIFKGSDLIDRVPKELWKRFIQVWGPKHPQEKEMQEDKVVV